MPYALDGGGDGGAGAGGRKAFTSWREREGEEPVAAGPHWADVRRKLQEAGVDVFWDPRHAPEARGAPAAGIVLEDSPASSGEGEGGDSSGSADDNDDGDGDSEEKIGGGDSQASAGKAGMGRDGEEQGAAGAAAAADATAEREEGGLSWKKAFVVLVSCVGVGYVACTGTRRRRKRRRSAKRRKQLMEWSAGAFSTKTLSPLGTAKTTPSFGWTGAVRNKDHQV